MCTECYHPDSKWEASNQTISDCADMIMDLFSERDADIEEMLDAYRWRPFKFRQMTETEIARFYESISEVGFYAKDITDDQLKVLDGELPADMEDIIVSDGTHVFVDTFRIDFEDILCGMYLEGADEITEGMTWMPLPKPRKEQGDA